MSKFPKLPTLKIQVCNKPQPMIFWNVDAGFLVTKNFFADTPIWRRFKKIGWACRYAGVKKGDIIYK